MLLDELQIDFAMKRGHEMVVDLKAGIKRDQLDSIEIHMLQGQQIPKLLSVEWIDIDGGLTFRYPLNGKRMLQHRLQTGQMTMLQFYALLLAVVEVLDDCRHYMLRAECFLLHEQYIFIGENWEDASFAYVPLRGMEMVSSAGEAVLAMAIRWVSAIENPDGMGLQQVFQHLRGKSVSWDALRQRLLSLLGDSYRAGIPGIPGIPGIQGIQGISGILELPPHGQADLAKAAAGGIHPRNELPSEEGRPGMPQPAFSILAKDSQPPAEIRKPPIGRNGSNLREASELPLTEMPEEEQDAAGSSRRGWIIGAGWVLVTAVVWRFLYLSAPTMTNLLLCGGITLLTGVVALIGLRSIKGSGAEEEELQRWNEEPEWSREDAFVPNSIQLGESQQQMRLSRKLREAQAPSGDALAGGRIARHEAPIPVKPPAYVGAASEITVLLGQEAKEKPGTGRHLPWLERQGEGQAEKIRLEQAQFIIGRSNEGVHYVDQSSGISRAHIELSGSEGRWSVKDMGSRNGSTLNGSVMIPYKPYALSDTDRFQLAGEEGPVYVFRAG